MTEEDFKVGIVVSGETASIYKLPEKADDYTMVSVITEQADDNAYTVIVPIGKYRDLALPSLIESGAEITYFGMEPIELEATPTPNDAVYYKLVLFWGGYHEEEWHWLDVSYAKALEIAGNISGNKAADDFHLYHGDKRVEL